MKRNHRVDEGIRPRADAAIKEIDRGRSLAPKNFVPLKDRKKMARSLNAAPPWLSRRNFSKRAVTLAKVNLPE